MQIRPDVSLRSEHHLGPESPASGGGHGRETALLGLHAPTSRIDAHRESIERFASFQTSWTCESELQNIALDRRRCRSRCQVRILQRYDPVEKFGRAAC